MRILIVTNMYPTAERPHRGVFVREQLEALCEIPGLDVELFALPPGRHGYIKGVSQLREYLKTRDFDLFHAHYGFTGWVAHLAGCSPLVVTFHGTDLSHPRFGAFSRAVARRADLAITVSHDLAEKKLRGVKLRRPLAVVPSGVDLERFKPIDKREARERLGLDLNGKYVFFPADPARAEKRFDRALVLMKEFIGPQLLMAGNIEPDDMVLWHNAANVVIVPSDYEGFGLATVEALACNIPVIATPTGIAPELLQDLGGTFCAPFDLGAWCRALGPLLADADLRIEGRRRAELFGSRNMAERLSCIYKDLLNDAHGAATTQDEA